MLKVLESDLSQNLAEGEDGQGRVHDSVANREKVDHAKAEKSSAARQSSRLCLKQRESRSREG